jgi:hypothetical protein
VEGGSSSSYGTLVSVGEGKESEAEITFALGPAFPNPLNPSTVIQYQIHLGEEIELKVSDLLGREVASLLKGYQHAGAYQKKFDGGELPSGVYLYKLQEGSFTEVKRMLLLK